MIKDEKLLEKFERKEHAQKRYTYRDALTIFEALWQEAKDLGALPPKDLQEGIEPILRIARALNYRK